MDDLEQDIGVLTLRGFIRRFFQCVILLPMLVSACGVRQGPSDLMLRTVFLSEASGRINGWHEDDPPTFSHQVIVLELTSIEPYAPQIPFILKGYCGDPLKISGLDLYVPPDRAIPDRLDQAATQANPERPYNFYVLMPVWSTRGLFGPEDREYNLEHDSHDICLRTKFMQQSFIWLWRLSNEVRVPRRLIDQAFQAGLKPLPAMKRL